MPSASDTDVTIAPTKGTSTSASARRAARPAVRLAAVCSTSATDSDFGTGNRTHRQTFELMVVELVGFLDRRQVGDVDEEQRAAQRIGGVAVLDAGRAGPAGARRVRAHSSTTKGRSAPPRLGLPRSVLPATKRADGSSVRMSTTTSPAMP